MSLDLHIFNQYAQSNKGNLLKKALTSASGVAGALIPQNLEKEITNTIIRLSPELALVTMKKIAGNYHEFNRLNTLPKQGGAMGESGTTPARNATYTRTGVTLKIIRRRGRVTDFLRDTSEENIDAVAVEMENNLTQHVYDLINTIIYGNNASNSYEFSGLDYFIATNRVINARYGITPTSLEFLDDMIDASTRKGGARHKKAFFMSPEMLSKVSRLLTNVRLNQGITGSGLTQVNLNGGWRLFAYRDIPVIESGSMAPQSTMGTVTPTTNAAGGTIPDDTYYFKVAAIVGDGGEQLADACSQVAAGGGTSIITLTFAAVAGAYRYKIYCGLIEHSEVLVCEIPAVVYDASGTIGIDVTTVTFSTNPSTANPTISAPAELTGITASIPIGMQADLAYEQESNHGVPETVILWDLDPIQGLGKLVYTNRAGSNFDGLVTTEPLGKTDDWVDFLIKSYPALTDSFEATSYMVRGYRTS